MELKIKDGRGENMRSLRDSNRELIVNWFIDNPDSTQKECAEGLGLSLVTVWNHLKAIREEPVE